MKYAATTMMRMMIITPISAPITPPAIAQASGGGCVGVGGCVGGVEAIE